MSPLVYKTLGSDNVTIRPFKVHKTQVLSYTSGSGDIEGLNVATAISFPINTVVTESYVDRTGFDPFSLPTNEDGTYQEPLYESVVNLFYDSALYTSRSIVFSAGGDGDRGFTPSGSVYVINFPQSYWGEGIRKGTFALTISGSTGTVVDDPGGRLYVSGALTSSVIGNLFYNLGIAVINRLTGSIGGVSVLPQSTSSLGGIYVPSGSTTQTTFDATLTIYEYQIVATINPGEFNFSLNPSAYSLIGASTGSRPRVADVMVSGTLNPYVTTIGLYNDYQELVAVAKLPRPIKRLRNSQQSFVVRFDA